jgi:hypothetical protein
VAAGPELSDSLYPLPRISRAEAPTLAIVLPEDSADGGAICRELQMLLGGPVIGLLTTAAGAEVGAEVHVLPLPVASRALRTLVQRLQPSAAA